VSYIEKFPGLLEGLGLAALSAGAIPILMGIWPGRGLYLFLAGLIYLHYLRRYRRSGRMGLWVRFHLLEVILAQVAGAVAGALTLVLTLFFMGGRDYGVPMLAGFVFGLLALVLFPPLFVGAHLPLLWVVRRFFFKEMSLREAWRLTMLGLILYVPLLAAGKGLVSLYARTAYRSSPEVLSGPAVVLYRWSLPYNETAYFAFLDGEFLHGRRVVSAELRYGEGGRDFFWTEELERGFLVWRAPMRKAPDSGALLRLATEESVPFVGTRPGPFYELPVKGVEPLHPFVIHDLHWEKGGNPALVLEFEGRLPVRLTEVCFNFGGRPVLRAGSGLNYRDLRLKAASARYLVRGKEEYYCYEPLRSPEPSPGRRSRVRFPMPREDFRDMLERGILGTGRAPLEVRGLVRGELTLGGALQGQAVEEAFRIRVPFPDGR